MRKVKQGRRYGLTQVAGEGLPRRPLSTDWKTESA